LFTLKYYVIGALIIAAQMSEAEPSISIQLQPEETQENISKSNMLFENYSTDDRLVDYVMDRIVLPNSLIVRRWRWTATAKALGINELPSFGFLSQDVQSLYPDIVFENTAGYLVFDRKKLIEKDKFVRELSDICGVFYGCSKYRQHVLMKNNR
jgi:hypothetical protein